MQCAIWSGATEDKEIKKTERKGREFFGGGFDPPPPRQEFLATPLLLGCALWAKFGQKWTCIMRYGIRKRV